jgi:hypothetical protein
MNDRDQEQEIKMRTVLFLHRNAVLAGLLFELSHELLFDLSDQELRHNASILVVISMLSQVVAGSKNLACSWAGLSRRLQRVFSQMARTGRLRRFILSGSHTR